MFAKRFSVFEILRVILGAVAWLFLLGVDLLAGTHLGTIQLMFLLAPLVVVPLGFLLGRAIAGDHDNADERWARLFLYCEPVAAALVVGSFWLPRNVEAALLTIPWLLVCVLKGVLEVFRFSRHRERRAENFCFLASLLYLPVGAAGLVISRAGATPLGFEEPILLLFAVHYHFSGFAAPLLAGLLGRRLGQFQGSSSGLSPGWYRTFRLVAAGVVTGPLLLALGFLFHSPTMKLLSVHLLVLSLIVLSVLHLPVIMRERNLLLAVSAVSLLVGMVLASIYGVGDFVGRIYVSIPRMAMSHGVINGLGFVVCGMVAWATVKTRTASRRKELS